MVPPIVEVVQGVALVPDQTVATVFQKGEAPLEAEAVSVVGVEVEVAHTVPMNPTIKVPRKATWEATTASSQAPRKIHTMAMVVSMQECMASLANRRIPASMMKDMVILKVRLNPYRQLNRRQEY